MSNVITDKPGEFTASDVLSPKAWVSRGDRQALGIDVVCTKIAVDFQNIQRSTAAECVQRGLEALREASGSDCAFYASLSNTLEIKDIQLAAAASPNAARRSCASAHSMGCRG
jgi:hypothetical protein